MKAQAGVFIQAVHEGGERLPQWARVYRAVRRAVDEGGLEAGARLPSARQLARDWKVSRGAVDEAFAQLQADGLVERRVGDGSYVCPTIALGPPRPPREARDGAPPALSPLRSIQLPPARREGSRELMRPTHLHPRAMPLDLFPLEAWRRLVTQAHDEGQYALLGGGPPGGLPALREAIARHLALSRGLSCAPEQVMVISGPREGLSAIAAELLQPGDLVATEDPSHPSLPQLFGILGTRVQAVAVDGEGLDVAALRRDADGARAVYLHPLSQYPLGERTSDRRAAQLLAWADERQSWIIEGHYNDEWVPRAQQPPTLFSRDTAARVLLLGTFEGVMFPSLRVAYLVLPRHLAPRFVEAHAQRGERVPLGAQWAVAQFIDSGGMNDHLMRVRADLALRREQVRTLLRQAAPAAVRVGPMNTGAQVCLHLPPALPDVRVAERLREMRIVVEAVSPMAWSADGTTPARAVNAIVLGYAGWPLPEVLERMRTVCAVLVQLLSDAKPPAGDSASPTQG